MAETLRRMQYVQRGGHGGNNDNGGKNISATTDVATTEANGDSNDEALATAQTLLDALNVTCPGGRVASGRGHDRIHGGIYDERGALYEVPAWLVRDPDDLRPDEDDSHDEKGMLAGIADQNTTSPNADESGEAEKSPAASRRRSDFKGKGRAEDFGEQIAVRARLSDRARDVIVHIGERQPASAVLNAVRAKIGLDPEPESTGSVYTTTTSAKKKEFPRVRLVYLGKALDLRRSLAENGWSSSHVVNAFVYLPDDAQAPK